MTARDHLEVALCNARSCREHVLTAQLQASEEDSPLLQFVLQERLAEARALEGKLLTLINLTAP